MAGKRKRDPWRSRIVGEADVDPAALRGHPQNWRRHPDRQRAALTGALDELGWVQRIVVNRTTGHVIDGHLRLEEAFRRGEDTVPVVYVELDEHDEKKALATFDPIGALADPDNDALLGLLADVSTGSPELQAMLDEITGVSHEEHAMRQLNVSPLPEMGWWLIGLPLERAADAEEAITALSAIPGAVVETSVT